MATAIELKRMGMDVRIIDKVDHMARYSQALVVQARTLEQFQRYGLAGEAIARTLDTSMSFRWPQQTWKMREGGS